MTETENPRHEMKNRGTILGCWWAGETIAQPNEASNFTTPLLLAASKYKYIVTEFWFYTAAKTKMKEFQKLAMPCLSQVFRC